MSIKPRSFRGFLVGLVALVAGACSHDWSALEPTSAAAGTAASGEGGGGSGAGVGPGGRSATTTNVGSGGGGAPSGSGGAGGGSCVDECVSIPDGWTPVIATSGAPNATTPTCDDGSAATKLFVGPAGPPTCDACHCDGSAATCSVPDVTCWTDTQSCDTTPAFTIRDASSCTNQSVSGGSNAIGSCSLSSPGSASGCSTSGGAATTVPKWSSLVFTCASPYAAGAAAGCSAAAVCAPASAPLCIQQAAAAACPAGFMSLDADAYADGTDQRMCTPCSCSISCSGGSVDVWDQSGCSGTKVNVSGTCTIVLNVFDSGSAAASGTPGRATLDACTGGEPMGSVVPTGSATKICCR